MLLREENLRIELCETLRRMAAGGLVRGTEGNVSARAGELLDGPEPSVELPMHLAVLAARADVGAVVHTHSPRATALSVAGRCPVPVAEAAPSGTAALGRAVLEAAGDGDAVVVRGHGPVCFGADLAAALARAVALEEQARLVS